MFDHVMGLNRVLVSTNHFVHGVFNEWDRKMSLQNLLHSLLAPVA